MEIEREEDGRWITEVPDLPGVMAYGQTQSEAVAKVKALAFLVMAHPHRSKNMSCGLTGGRRGNGEGLKTISLLPPVRNQNIPGLVR
jgi:hypothetical protein